MQTIAKQTDWETNGQVIASVLTSALERDHEALHAASSAARRMSSLSGELTDKTDRAAEAQMDASNKFHFATKRLQELHEAHEQGKWRRWGMIILIGALCAAVGFFVREPAAKFDHLWEARTTLKQDVTSSECGILDGVNLIVDGSRACVIKEDPS